MMAVTIMERDEEVGCLDRLCDTRHYTGSHLHRFDAAGKGRGAAGRDRIYKGQGTIREWNPQHEGQTPKHVLKLRARKPTTHAQPPPTIRGARAAFARWADDDAEMHGQRFAKLCKECRLIGSGFSGYEVDVTFKKAAKGARVLDAAGFARALDIIGEKRMQDTDELVAKILARDRPPSAPRSR